MCNRGKGFVELHLKRISILSWDRPRRARLQSDFSIGFGNWGLGAGGLGLG